MKVPVEKIRRQQDPFDDCGLYALIELNFPAILALGVMTREQNALDCFPPLIDAGCAVVFGYQHNYNGWMWGHSVVAESYEGEGITVLCSSSPKNEGEVVKWIDEGPDEDDDPRLHGNRNIVPWDTIPYTAWSQRDGQAVGIARDYVIAYPLSDT
ncbi:MAG: hypothetical protein DMF68_11570 [Acidobacteria bacterium]|nr:MAG: hypothetical protein DMF68_11570 [Acidobacteriota bacterium]